VLCEPAGRVAGGVGVSGGLAPWEYSAGGG
jgi:hypothetical protein